MKIIIIISNIFNRLSLTEDCNADCGCPTEKFEAVCGVDGYTYFSPCHAGCATQPRDNIVRMEVML